MKLITFTLRAMRTYCALRVRLCLRVIHGHVMQDLCTTVRPLCTVHAHKHEHVDTHWWIRVLCVVSAAVRAIAGRPDAIVECRTLSVVLTSNTREISPAV